MATDSSADRHLDLDGLPRLRYRDEGRGPAVLLIHGWLLDLTMFDSLVECLVGGGFRVVRWDRRGFGGSAGVPNLADDVTDGLRLLDHLDVPRCAVFGMSQGCRIALALAESATHRTACLVLDGPPPLEGLPDLGWQNETPLEAYRRLLLERGAAAVRTELAAHPLYRLQADDAAAKTRLAAMLARYTGADLTAPDRARNAVPDDRLRRVSVPVLVLNGEFDSSQRLRVGEALAQLLPEASRRIVTASRHLACWDNPAAYNRFVIDFLVTNIHRWA